jgi:hypothetical protein
VLRKAVADHRADLMVVGNKGLNTLSGRLLGSVPSDVARRSGVDVLAEARVPLGREWVRRGSRGRGAARGRPR